jgi:uncharacterized protein with HEPN domain
VNHPGRVEDYLEHMVAAIERAMRYVGNLKSLQSLERDEQALAKIQSLPKPMEPGGV